MKDKSMNTTTAPLQTIQEECKKTQQWAEFLLKDAMYYQSYSGRYQCIRLLYTSDAAEYIPTHCRWVLWSKFVDLQKHTEEILPLDCYGIYLNSRISLDGKDESTEQTIKQILLDIPRTVSENCTEEEKQQIFNVLYAVAMFQPKVGYCQGMSYIAAHLLSIMETEEQAFLLFVTLMQKYEMFGLFLPGFPKLKEFMYIFSQTFKSKDRKLWDHLENLGVSPELYIPKWLLSMFCIQFPAEFVGRVWDAFVLYGWSTLYQVALSLLISHRTLILECQDMETAMHVIQDGIPQSVVDKHNRQRVMSSCPKMIREMDIKRGVKEYEQKLKAELQEEAEEEVVVEQQDEEIQQMTEDEILPQQIPSEA